MPGRDADAATEQIAEDLRQSLPDQLAARTLGGDRGMAKPLMPSDEPSFDLQPVQKERIHKTRRQRKKWQRRARRRKKGSHNQQKAYRQVAHYQQYEAHVHHEYAHHTRHALVVNAECDLFVLEDLRIQPMTKRPSAKRDVSGRFLPNGARAKAGLQRAILPSAWGEGVSFRGRHRRPQHGGGL